MNPNPKAKKNNKAKLLLLLGCAASLAILSMLIPAEPRHKASKISCPFSMQSIGLGLRLWSEDHQGQFPFNVSTNLGGSMELCRRNADGFDQNAISHYMLMIPELGTPHYLACQSDTTTKPAIDFQHLKPENITYQLRTGTNINTGNSSEVMVVCPIHGHILFADGSFRMGKRR